MKSYKILALNLGSTSTKLAVFEGGEQKMEQVLRHTQEEMGAIKTMADNAAFRKPLILAFLKENNVDLKSFDAVVGRGGLMRPIPGGTYAVNQAMLDDLASCKYGSHASNLGGILASEIASEIGVPAYIVDPVVVDEMEDVARLSGHPSFKRRTCFHALNQKAIAKRYASEVGVPYTELNLIVAHMGGGVTVGAHMRGRVIDVNNGLDGEGPYSAERPGGLPALEVMRVMDSGELGDYAAMKRTLTSRCGLIAYLGTNNGIEVGERIKAGDKEAELVYRGMAYQIAKEIGAMAAVLYGEVDAILLTGGFAYDKTLMGWITEQVKFIAPVKVYPGEDEMGALAAGALRVLAGEEEVKTY
ncbi:MAG: butyrate kinase [Eubacteriales bacterium]|nr:butyrate kinase [Eubacteriales bacterium]